MATKNNKATVILNILQLSRDIIKYWRWCKLKITTNLLPICLQIKVNLKNLIKQNTKHQRKRRSSLQVRGRKYYLHAFFSWIHSILSSINSLWLFTIGWIYQPQNFQFREKKLRHMFDREKIQMQTSKNKNKSKKISKGRNKGWDKFRDRNKS